ncbi:hypothetical protein A0J61_08118 [Choanephora cucurbitarum]|uniref:Uncharacterized protein n=1 Tax=Choanephora cucurbitarum TaxID=101091 RepID=A0A1C7N909_9FUNG|nr:hypothetical protein A0J61_08118 [Choanephora cucurbitarum]
MMKFDSLRNNALTELKQSGVHSRTEFASFALEKKSEIYGKSRQMPSALRAEITDILKKYHDDDLEKLEKLTLLKLKNKGINAIIVKALLLLFIKTLFACDALRDCRQDFLIEANHQKPLTKVVGEIKGEASGLEELAVDSYRLGVFGRHML